MPATFKFYIRDNRKDDRGTCPIYLRITHNRKRKYINTGIRLKPDHWHPGNEQVRRSFGKKHEVHKINKRLAQIRIDAEDAYWELHSENKVSADAIKKRLSYSSKDNFFTLAKEYLDEIKHDSFWTHKQTKVAIEKIKDFHGSDNLPVNLIDADFLTRFQNQLKRKNKPSTIIKNLGCIRNILDIAVRQHLININPVKSNDFTMVKPNNSTSKTKLSLSQIKALKELNLKPGSNLWHARNAFLVSFYFCGMRFGDVAELRWENFKNGRLEYDMNKTGNPVSLPVKDGPKQILDAYRDFDYNGYVFHFLSNLTDEEQSRPDIIRKRISSWNAYVNSCLKDIAEMAGIKENISMHVARHSFAQYGVNDLEIPPYKMMMLLGHKSLKTTMQYLKSLDLKAVDSAMDLMFNEL